ncbi:toll/interleukin-1 receptor domain-containing protein [Nocardiopsis coralliicola]
MAHADWDVFFSYPRADYRLAEPLISALRERGLRIFVDSSNVRDFSSISRSLAENLARSTLLLAFYSERYLYRRSCNFELTATYVAGQREGDPCRRIAVVNPHTGFDHVHPTELRDRRSLSLYEYSGRLDALAAAIEEQVRSVGGAIGAPPEAAATPWYPPPPPVGSTAAQPFRAELWAAHSALRPGAAAYHTGAWEGGTARLCSLDRAAAAAFAQDYALQFSASYPGGIFWFSMGERPEEPAEDAFTRGLATVCELLGIGEAVRGDPAVQLAEVAERIDRSGAPSLWVLDGLPAPHGHAALRRFRNPQPRGSTLITGAVSRADDPGTLVDIAFPDLDGMRPVLLQGAPPVVGSRPGQDESADLIVRKVGGHPAALAAARRLLTTADPPDLAYALVERRLDDPDEDVLSFAPRYSAVLDGLADCIGALSAPARAAVVWASRVEGGWAPVDRVVRALSLLEPGSRGGAAGTVAELGDLPFIRLAAGRLGVHPLVTRTVRYRCRDSDMVGGLNRVWERAQ